MRQWRPLTTRLLVVGVVLIFIALVAGYIVNNFHPTTEVKLGSAVFHTQLATTDATRQQGLSGVEKLNPDGGLLMVFPTDGFWGIWMKDMKTPLDIIWLNNDKKVIHIVTNALPDLGTSKTFQPTDLARYVLEVPAGTVKSTGIKTDNTAVFNVKAGE